MPAAIREEGGADAKAESDHSETGDNTLTPASRIKVALRENPENPLLEVKKEKSSNESQALHQVQRSRSHEHSESPCVPESDQRRHVTGTTHEYALVDVVSELRIVKEKCRQLRTQVESVDARHVETLKAE